MTVQITASSPAILSQNPLRVLVIGAGPAAAAMHLPILARLRDRGDIALVLVCDIQSERATAARRQFGFLEQSGDGVAALEREDIDAVYIFASAQLHYEYGMTALRNGKHLFVEKPVAPTYADARAMGQCAQLQSLIAVGGLNRRFFKSLAAVRARAGGAGWRYAEAVFHKPEFGKEPLFGARSWLSANGIHALDTLIFMMGGVPEHLTALARSTGAGGPSAFSAVMSWPDGAQGVFLCNNDAGARREEYVFHGLGETYGVAESGLTVDKDGKSAKTAYPFTGDGIAAEHEAFLDAIRTGAEPAHSIAAVAPSLYLAELIESGFSGRVRLPEVEHQVPLMRPLQQASILVASSLELSQPLARLLPRYRLVTPADVAASPGERTDIVAAILGRGSEALRPEILSKLPQLSIVGIMGLSLANHDPHALLARGITVVNASDAYADCVAEFAFGLAILGRRRAFVSHEVMRAGGWGTSRRAPGIRGLIRRAALRLRPVIRAARLESMFLRLWRAAVPVIGAPAERASAQRDLRGAMIGLIGWGANARAFAQRLRQAGATVLVYSEHAAADDIAQAGATAASLTEVLAADIVSLHRGLTARTRHSLGAAELAKLRPGAVLINVARGALIEPDALLARLRRGDVFACLDTYEEEPPSASHPLRRLPNVFLTSHIAGGSRDMHANAADEVVRKVAAHLAGDDVESISAKRLRTAT